MAATVAERTRFTGLGSSGDVEASATSIKQRQWQSKLGLSATTGRRRGDRELVVTAKSAAHIGICGKGCGKTAKMAVTTWWQSKLGLTVALTTAMSAARQQQ